MKVGDKVKINYCADKEYQDKVGVLIQNEKFNEDYERFTGWSLKLDDDTLNEFYCEVNNIYVNEYVFRDNELSLVTRNNKLARKMYPNKKESECKNYLV